MGRQMYYTMNREQFLDLANAAIESGCYILKKNYTALPQIPQADTSCITPECSAYYFYLPELCELQQQRDLHGKYYIPYGYNPIGLSMIEAGFSLSRNSPARIFLMSGYYSPDGEWIAKSPQISKVYDFLVRKIRKNALEIL